MKKGFCRVCGRKYELAGLLIKFVKMPEKKNKQNIINEIKRILNTFGFENL